MNRYTKVINMMESYFTKDFEKAKKGITKTREVKEKLELETGKKVVTDSNFLPHKQPKQIKGKG